jgi:DNA-binding NarL/FixJ family response regulator
MGFSIATKAQVTRGSLVDYTASAARVLVVDDHGIVREGLAVLIERETGLTVVGSVASGEAAVSCARQLRPDVVIMDLVLPELNGFDATRQILEFLPLTRIIALSACHSPEHVYRALRAGARGYVVKAAAGATLVTAIRTVLQGIPYVSPGTISHGIDEQWLNHIPKSPYERLSRRERDVLHHIVAGASSADIARELSLSAKTIDTYRGRLMVKLGVNNRSALIRLAIESEMTSP